MTSHSRYTVPVLAFFIAACGPAISVGTSTASDLQPAAYRTYTWEESDHFPTGDPRLDNNQLFVAEVQRSTDDHLSAMGLKRVPTGGDLLVHFHATVRERVNVYEVDQTAGYDQRAYGAGTQMIQYEEGTIIIDLAESEGKRLIWRGWMQTDIGGAIGNDAELARRVRAGVTKLFEKFPAVCVAR